MHQPARVGVRQRVTDLTQQEEGSFGGYRTEVADERLEVAPRQELHRVVKRPLVGDAEVEDVNRVRRSQRGSRPGLALEPAENETRIGIGARAEHLGTNELDRCIARKQPVLGPPDLAHPAMPQQLDQLIIAQLLRFAKAPAEAVKHV